jgi:hypothetical protein
MARTALFNEEDPVNIRAAAGIAAIALALLLTGCLTPPAPLAVKGSPLRTAEAEGLRATARFIDDDTLIHKFGKTANPYITDYASLQLRRFIVFELSIENNGTESLRFRLNRLELQFADKALLAYNDFRINQYWEFKDKQTKTQGSDKARRERIVRDTILPDSGIIPANGKLNGYAVFAGNTPSYGNATLYVPVLALSGEVAQRLEMAFEF